jgi:hypothetical protein
MSPKNINLPSPVTFNTCLFQGRLGGLSDIKCQVSLAFVHIKGSYAREIGSRKPKHLGQPKHLPRQKGLQVRA